MLIALLVVGIIPVYASAATIATATIPVTVSVSGEEGTLDTDIPEETYTFVLTAVDSAPMPSSDTLTITGSGSASFEIDYSIVGVYQYTVKQDSTNLSGENSTCNDRGNYDDTVYYVTVTVTNTEDGGYGVTVAVHKGSTTGDKVDLAFENTYDPVPYDSLTVKKTWTDNDQTRPDTITVNLYDGDAILDTVTLSSSNSWTYTWSTLDPYAEHTWDVKEVAVDGYTASYTTSGTTITIHNTGDIEEEDEDDETLIQTGQTNWPIPILLSIGLALIAIGVYAMMRDQKRNRNV